MLKCILGERNSGKSIFVEKQIKKIDGNVLYVATLPNLKIYKEIIFRHKQRRPPFWDCIELFEMTAEQIVHFPYHNYQYVIIDNLSYYVLFQRIHNENMFLQKCNERFFSLIDKIAVNKNIIVYFVDTPFENEILKSIDEEGIIEGLFKTILGKSQVIERFYCGEIVCPLTTKQANDYLFCV